MNDYGDVLIIYDNWSRWFLWNFKT